MIKYLKDEIDSTTIFEVSKGLKAGKLVVFPTDTVYGLGTNAYDEVACSRIYEVKGRPKNKPLIVLISDISMLVEMVEYISPMEQKLMDTFWPGPLTIMFRKKEGVLPSVIAEDNEYIGVRLVNEGIIYDIIRVSGVPVVAPSANLSGSITGTKIENIVSELGDKVDYILDFGDIKSDMVSTIVQVEDKKAIVIREGKIKKEEIGKVVPLKRGKV